MSWHWYAPEKYRRGQEWWVSLHESDVDMDLEAIFDGKDPEGYQLLTDDLDHMAEQLKKRHSTYNNAVRELLNWEQQGKAWVLHPSQPIEIGRLERHAEKLQAVYDLGTGDAQTALDSLQAFLAQN